MLSRGIYVATGVALVVTLMACGHARDTISRAGDKSTVATAGRGVSEFKAAAEVICQRFKARRHAIAIRNLQDFQRLVPLSQYELAAVREMRKLAPPAPMRESWRQLIEAATTLASATRQTAAVARSKEFELTPAAAALSRLARKATLRMTAAGRRLRLSECAQP
jgi:hypothetical protein